MNRTVGTLARTLILAIGVTTLTSSLAAAQALSAGGAAATPAATAPSFASAIQGRNVWITADGTQVRGLVSSISPTSLVLVEDGVATTIAYKDIVRVEKSTHRLRNGTLIGLASGAGLGLVIGAAYCGGDEWCEPGTILGLTGFYAGLGAAAGVGIGAVVHAVNKSGDVIYDARRTTTTMSFAPILSKTQRGVAFSMSWR